MPVPRKRFLARAHPGRVDADGGKAVLRRLVAELVDIGGGGVGPQQGVVDVLGEVLRHVGAGAAVAEAGGAVGHHLRSVLQTLVGVLAGKGCQHLAGDDLDEFVAIDHLSGSRPQIALLDVGDLGDPPGVPVRAPWCCQPLVDDLQGEALPDETGAEGEDVGVVVLAAVAGRREVVAERRPHPGHLVGGHARTDAGAVDDDAPAAHARADQICHRVREVRVVDRFGADTPAVVDGAVLLSKVLDDRLFELVAAVI